MPRAFLIKKHYSQSSSSSARASKRKFGRPAVSDDDELSLHEPKDYSKKQSLASDSGSDVSTSPVNSPSPPLAAVSPLPQHQYHLYYRHPFIKDDMPATATALIARSSLDIYGRPPVLEPLNINATTANSVPIWVKPFLPSSSSSYLPPPPYTNCSPFQQRHSPSSTGMYGGYYPSEEPPMLPHHHHRRRSLSPLTQTRDAASDHAGKNGDAKCLDLVAKNGGASHAHSISGKLAASSPPAVDQMQRRSTEALHWTEIPAAFAREQHAAKRESSRNDAVAVHRENDEDVSAYYKQTSQVPSSGRRRAPDGPRYHCPDCNKSYSTYSGLSKHQQFHCSTNNKRSFSCKYCEKVYVSLGALKMHIRTHTLPCQCKLCGKAFSRPWLLQGHIRTHTGEKPFTCPHCNRAFADRSNLRAHLQTHSDVKKYSCKTCAKTFSRMSLLVKHEDSGCCGGTVTAAGLVQERLGP